MASGAYDALSGTSRHDFLRGTRAFRYIHGMGGAGHVGGARAGCGNAAPGKSAARRNGKLCEILWHLPRMYAIMNQD